MKNVFVVVDRNHGMTGDCYTNVKMLWNYIKKNFTNVKQIELEFSNNDDDISAEYNKKKLTYGKLIMLCKKFADKGLPVMFSVQPAERYGLNEGEYSHLDIYQLRVVSKTPPVKKAGKVKN